MTMGMEKSGNILEHCDADLKKCRCSLYCAVNLSGIPASLSLTNLCHQMMLWSSLWIANETLKTDKKFRPLLLFAVQEILAFKS